MIFNKSYLTTFSKNKPYLALASKGKILDSKFTFTSELSLYDYSLDKHYPALQTDSEYCKLVWCEKDNMQILATGHTNGSISLYEPDTSTSFRHIKTFEGLTGKVMGIDYNPSKNVIAAGSSSGNIIFWNLDKIDQQYKCDIPITENITSLAWNNKVSKILCVGTECGKIIVLDIRLKRIAMTLQYPDIKTINNIRWHSKSSTSLFASTNLNCLSCFKLDSNSRTHVGEYENSSVNFSTVNKDTVVRYSDSKIDYIDLDSLSVRESIKIENVFDVSFSPRDPIYCCSYNSGTTELFTTSVSSISLSNPHVQFNNCIVGSEIFNMKGSKIFNMKEGKFEIQANENVESKLLDILYDRTNFKFDKETRIKIADMLLEDIELFRDIKSNVENEGIIFDLEDKLIKKLIKNEEIKPEDNELIEGRTVSLRLFLNLIKKEKTAETEPLNFLLSLIVLKDYDKLWKIISSKQWTVIVAILLYSNLPNDQVSKKIKEIQEELNLPILSLLVNEPTNFFNTRESTPDLPKTVFEVNSFFKKYGGEIVNLKKLNLKYDNPLLDEYFWFAKNHGMYNDLKDIGFEDYIIKTYIGFKQQGSNIEKEVSRISLQKPTVNLQPKPTVNLQPKPTVNLQPKPTVNLQPKPISTINIKPTVNLQTKPVSNIQTKPMPEVLAHAETKPVTQNTVPRPSLYSAGSNKSVSSFSTKPVPKEGSSSFSAKPAPPKKSLYSGVLNRSATSFSTRPDSSVSTYGQQSLSSSSIPTPGSSIPTPSNSIPTPSNTVYPSPGNAPIPTPNSGLRAPVIPQPSSRSTPVPNNTVVEQAPQTNYDVVAISKSLEELFETLKQTAGKKNNLIVGNKIKDAVRRFSIFQQIDKNEIPVLLLEKIKVILEILETETDKNSIKQKVRSIIDECIEMRSCQSDIWMPAIAILVQLVY